MADVLSVDCGIGSSSQAELIRELSNKAHLDVICALLGLAWAVTTFTVGVQVQNDDQSCIA